MPGNVLVLLGALGVGVLAGALLPFRDLGLGTFLVLLAAGGVLLAASRHRRDPFTLACAGLCLALLAVVVLRDAEWIVVLCLLAGAGSAASGWPAAGRFPAFVLAGAVAWPLAGLRGLPWLGRTARRSPASGDGAPLLRTVVWSLLGVTVFALLFASADALFAEWVGAVVPDLGSADVRRCACSSPSRSAACAGRRRTSPSTRHRSTARARRAARSPTASSGWRRCWSSTRSS